MSDHPSRDVLTAFVRGELPMKEVRALKTHLAEPCFECTGVMEIIRQDLSEGRSGTRQLTPEEDAAYSAAISRAFRRPGSSIEPDSANRWTLPRLRASSSGRKA